jgi:hypothetical protein
MKKSYLPHHTITAKGGRVASRVTRHAFKASAVARVTPSGMDLGIAPAWMRRTRAKDSRLGMEE